MSAMNAVSAIFLRKLVPFSDAKHLERDPSLLGQCTESIRLRLHPEARIVAQPGGVVLWETGQDPVARHPSEL